MFLRRPATVKRAGSPGAMPRRITYVIGLTAHEMTTERVDDRTW